MVGGGGATSGGAAGASGMHGSGGATGPDASLDAGAGGRRASADAAADRGDAARDTSNDGAPSDARDAGPTVPPGYPAGPYGTSVGETFPYLVWVGHVNESASGLSRDVPSSGYTSDDLRRSGRPYALVHVSDFDCPGCNSAARALVTEGPAMVAEGAAVVEVLGSQGFFYPATDASLTAWLTTYDLTVTAVIDAPGHALETLHAAGVRETAVIVDLSTMKVVWKDYGDQSGMDPPSIDAASVEMRKLIGD